jgi:hypothetical protein
MNALSKKVGFDGQKDPLSNQVRKPANRHGIKTKPMDERSRLSAISVRKVLLMKPGRDTWFSFLVVVGGMVLF